MQTVELIEEQSLFVPQAHMSESAAAALHSDPRFDFIPANAFNGYRHEVRSKGWIGHIPVSADTVIKIRPKVDVRNIFRMLEVAYNLKSFKFLEGSIETLSLEDLFERIVSVLARRVLDRVRKGLYRAYVTETDELGFVRGRIDLRDAIRRGLRGDAKLLCEFQDLTTDLEDNQILFWALFRASKVGLANRRVANEVRAAYRALHGTVSLRAKVPGDCVGRFYQRLNADYLPLHGLCRFILEHTGPDLDAGAHTFLPFALDMPRLFEAFVAEWLGANAPSAWSVKAQHAARLKANAELVFKMDIVIYERDSGRALAVLDTKYKAHETPSSEDVQQIVAYAVEAGVQEALLIYPMRPRRPVEARIGAIKVRSLYLDLAVEPLAAAAALLTQLQQALAPGHRD